MKVTLLERSPGSWRVRIETRDEAGRRKFSTETIRGTRLEAEARRVEILKAHKTGDLVEVTTDTVEQYWTRWQDRRFRLREINDRTYESQNLAMKPFLAKFGAKPLRAVTADDVQDFYVERLGSVAPTTVKLFHTHLKALFAAACEAGALTKNPMRKVTPPRGGSEARKPLEQRHIQALLAYAADKPFLGRMVRLALYTGLRRGELAGLCWSDIDFDRGTLSVNRTVVRVGKIDIVKAPKTEQSVRTIKMPQTLVDELRPVARRPDEPVLVTAYGGRPSISYMTRATKKALLAIGLGDGYCLHSTRHSHATHLLRQRMPIKAVSQRLGHATVEITLSVYAHAIPGDDEALAATIDRVMAA